MKQTVLLAWVALTLVPTAIFFVGCIDEQQELDSTDTAQSAILDTRWLVMHLDYEAPGRPSFSETHLAVWNDVGALYRETVAKLHPAYKLVAIVPAHHDAQDDAEISQAIAVSDKMLNALRVETPASVYNLSLDLITSRFKLWFDCSAGNADQYRKNATVVAAEISGLAASERDKAKAEFAENLARKRVAMARMSELMEGERDEFTKINRQARELLARHNAYKATESGAFDRLKAIAYNGARAPLGDIGRIEDELRTVFSTTEDSYAKGFQHDAKRLQARLATSVSAHTSLFDPFRDSMVEDGTDGSIEHAGKNITELIEKMMAYAESRRQEVDDAVKQIGVGLQRRKEALLEEQRKRTRAIPRPAAANVTPRELAAPRSSAHLGGGAGNAASGLRSRVNTAPSASRGSTTVRTRASILIGISELRRAGFDSAKIEDIVATLESGDVREAGAKYDVAQSELESSK